MSPSAEATLYVLHLVRCGCHPDTSFSVFNELSQFASDLLCSPGQCVYKSQRRSQDCMAGSYLATPQVCVAKAHATTTIFQILPQIVLKQERMPVRILKQHSPCKPEEASASLSPVYSFASSITLCGKKQFEVSK